MKRGLIIILFSLFAAPLIKAQPKALFSASPNKGCSPASIKFINQSTGSGLTYFWDLGNGNTSTLAEPKAIYYTPGFYTIKLKVTDKSGKIDSVTKSKYIEIFRNPKADFGAKVVKGCVPFDPGLTDKSTRGSGMINKWTWDYGDGKVSTGSSPVYSYTNQGVYKISLLIEDANGCKDSLSKSNYITASETPQILFMADKTYSCTKPLSVNFTNKSTGLASGDQFEWEFGDGTKSTDKNPKKTYNDTGSFSVTLKIKPVNGCNTSIEVKNYLTIWKPKVSFKIYPTPVCVGEDINFVSTTKPTHINFINKWDFGDGTFGGKNWTTHAYQKDGTYNVKLIVSMPDGTCKDSLIMNKVASIIPRPVANFIVKDTLLCLPGLKDTLIDITKGATIRYWYLNDEFISSKNAVITKVYNPGYNKVKLISGNGYCFDSIVNEKAIYVDSIDLNYFIAPRGGCVPLHVNFTDSTRSKLSISSWLWDLGDGNLQVAQTFDYTYYKEGMYIIELTVTTEKGCKNSTKDTIYATNKPIAEFHFPETVKCNSEIMEMIEAKSGKVPINQYKWYIDNELVSDKKQLSNILKRKPGKYDIKL
ncbi:MAG: PKD domain-containing protein, partial [Bacteroidia bacterium]